MTVTTKRVGFDEARLKADGGAELHAYYESGAFKVVTDENHLLDDNGWYFGAEDCREASEFFLMLAKELDRRDGE